MDHATPANPLLAGYKTQEQVASELGIKVKTLCRWHAARCGPPRTKVGQTILYRIDALQEWLRQKESGPVDQRRRTSR